MVEQRIPCKNCGAEALPSTIEKTNGYCMPCFKGPIKKSLFQRVEDIACNTGLMEETDRVAHIKSSDSETFDLSGDMGNIHYGYSADEILSNRNRITDAVLVSHVTGLLSEKESQNGVQGLTEEERHFFVVSELVNQLDNGGFSGYFYNTGHLTCFLEKALLAINAESCKEIVLNAIVLFGKMPSSDHESMLDELSLVTDQFENNLWDQLDQQFYNLEEDFDALLMHFMQCNQEQFLL